MQFIGSTIRN